MNALHAQAPPESETARVQAGRISEKETTDSAIVDPTDAERKRLAGLRASMALRGGYAVHELAQGGFLIVWRGQSREARDLEALQAFAQRIGISS